MLFSPFFLVTCNTFFQESLRNNNNQKCINSKNLFKIVYMTIKSWTYVKNGEYSVLGMVFGKYTI